MTKPHERFAELTDEARKNVKQDIAKKRYLKLAVFAVLGVVGVLTLLSFLQII